MALTAALSNRYLAPKTLGLPGSPSQNLTQIRLRIYLPQCYQQEPVISRLISAYRLVVNITGARQGCFDLELKGTPPQISHGLTYLESLNINIFGKANPDGDSWYC